MSKTKGVVKLVVNTDTTVSPQEPDSVKTEDSGLFIHSTNSANASKIWLSQGSATSASFAKLEFDTDFGLKINVNNPIQTSHDASIVFGTRGVDYWEIEGLNGSSGDLLPLTNNTLRIGRSSLNLSNIFSRQLSSDTSLVLATAGSTRWTLDSSGNLIPGTNSQNIGTSDLRLNTIFSNQITSGTNQALFLGSNAGSYRWYIANSTNAALVPNTANAFDLGTSTNRVATTFSVNINNSEAITTGTVNASSGVIADAIQTRTTSSALSFRTGTGYATRVTIDSSGNLGVGTSSPSTRLDVSGVVKSLGVSLSDFNGTANPSNPSLHFTNETNTGIYREKANYMSLVAGGQKGLSVDSTSGVALLLVGNGDPVSRFHVADDRFTSVSGITLGTDLNSFVQLYRSGNKTLTVNDRITTVSNGSALSPAYTVGGDSNTGIFSPGPDTWAVSTGGVERFRISSDGTVTISNVIVNNSTSAISSGSATAPAYSFGDDLNTGMFNPGADLLAISTGGVERLRVNASGNVGIGTLTPSSRFHVTGAGVNGGRGTFQSSDNANSVNVVGVNGAGINDSSFLYLEDQTNNALIGLTGTAQTAGHLRFAINSTERMRINSSGNVGIGYTSPSYRLHVNGDFGVSTNAVISAAGAITSASLSASGNILSQGVVGVGTNSPVSQLHVNASTGNSIIHVTNSTTGGTLSDGVSLVSESGTGDAFVIQRENARLILGTNNTNRFIITGAGNIGVGTIDPSALLHLIGGGGWSSNNYGRQLYITTPSGGSNPCIGISDSTGGNNWAIGNAAGSINFCQMPAITNSTTPIVERMRIDSSGNVGIGTTSPVFPLHVHTTTGNATLHLTNSTTGTTSADGFSLVSEVTTNDAYVIQRENASLIFRTNNAERLRIDPSGNVGIGLINPSQKLTISGTDSSLDFGVFIENNSTDVGSGASIRLRSGAIGASFGRIRMRPVGSAIGEALEFGTSACPIVFSPGGLERARFSASGNLGIGTTNPVTKLHVSSGTGNGEVFIGSTVQSLETGTDNSGAIYFGLSPSNPLVPSGAIEASWGNVGSPHISIGCPRDGNKTRARFGWDNTIRFYTANTEALRIDASSNIGTKGSIEVNSLGSGDRYALVDFWSANTPGDYNARIIRNPGENGNFDIVNRGVGILNIGSEGSTWKIFYDDLTAPTGSWIYNISTMWMESSDGNDAGYIGDTGEVGSDNSIIINASRGSGKVVFATNSVDRVQVTNSAFHPLTNNAIQCGTTGLRWSQIWVSSGVINGSDLRQKTDICDSTLGLSFINSLRPVSYKWIVGGNEIVEPPEIDNNLIDKKTKKQERVEPVVIQKPGVRTHWGLIAQEVKAAADDFNVDFGGWVLSDINNPESDQALRYDQFIAPLIKAVQELSQELSAVKAELLELKNK